MDERLLWINNELHTGEYGRNLATHTHTHPHPHSHVERKTTTCYKSAFENGEDYWALKDKVDFGGGF